jgi:hypothetical protein
MRIGSDFWMGSSLSTELELNLNQDPIFLITRTEIGSGTFGIKDYDRRVNGFSLGYPRPDPNQGREFSF